MNEAVINRQAIGLQTGSASTDCYSIARQNLPQEMVCTLARQTGQLLGAHTPDDVHIGVQLDSVIDGRGGVTSQCIASPVEIQAYSADLDNLESMSVSLEIQRGCRFSVQPEFRS